MFESLLAKIAGSAVRHGATSLGAILVADGLATNEQSQQLLGVACWAVPFAFSVYDKWKSQQKLAAAKAA